MHCLPPAFPIILTQAKRPKVSDGLLLVTPRLGDGPKSYLAIVDNNGEPRFHRRVDKARNFRRHADGRYSFHRGDSVRIYDECGSTPLLYNKLPRFGHDKPSSGIIGGCAHE